MGQVNYPATVSTSTSYSTIPPVNASSVLLDGSLTVSGTYSTTITGTGGAVYLYVNSNNSFPTTITISGVAYTVNSGIPVVSSAISGTQSVTIAAPYIGALTAWTSSTLPSSSNWVNVAYGNGIFIAVQNGGTSAAAYSTNGTSWSSMTMSSATSWEAVTYGNGYYVAIANSSTSAAYSTNGTTWTSMTIAGAGGQSIAYGNKTFVVVPLGSITGAYSTNATSWSSMTMPLSASWKSVTYGNGVFVAVAQSIAYSAYSSDGVVWTLTTLPSSDNWLSIAYGNGVFIAVGGSSSTAPSAISSDNGKTWTAAATSQAVNSITYGGGYFVIGGGYNALNEFYSQYTVNGTSWTNVILPYVGYFYSLAYGNGTFVGVSNSSTAVYFKQTQALPVTFGVYNGPTSIH